MWPFRTNRKARRSLPAVLRARYDAAVTNADNVRHWAITVPVYNFSETHYLADATVGHLFEAEDESQEWPELHAAIREARKAYQADGTMPDWEVLANLLTAHLVPSHQRSELSNGS